jgi:hypothetical protein
VLAVVFRKVCVELIRWIRLFTGADGPSHFETQVLALGQTSAEGSLSAVTAVQDMPFAESPVGSDAIANVVEREGRKRASPEQIIQA